MNSVALVTFLLLLAAQVMAAGPATSQAAPDGTSKVEMIFWEKQSWSSNGPSARLTIWADGRSEILVKQFGGEVKPKPQWTAKTDGQWTTYRWENPYTPEIAKQKLDGALAAGIGTLRSFAPGYSDGSGTLVGLEVDGKVTEQSIPMFLRPGEEDNQGSENEKRFLAVEKVLGDFDSHVRAQSNSQDQGK